ncbi:MAG: transposase [Ruminococcus flavefaciens]|nr:transposase [Ruminococcus flavefaciens]
MDTEESTVLEHREYAESFAASRDLVKIRKKSVAYGIEMTILGLENQEKIHYAMPMRVMGLDYAAYKKQYDSNAKQYPDTKGLTEDEYLSRMKQEDKFLPVVTLVVYYGESAWDGAKSLCEMLRVPEEIRPFVNDYKMFLVEARENNLKLHNMKNIDLFNLIHIMQNESKTLKENREEAISYASEHQVDKSVVMTVAGVANCKINYNQFDREGDGNMYTVFEETKKEGIIEGRREGRREGMREGKAQLLIEMGQEDGLTEATILKKLQDKIGLSMEQAKAYWEQYGNGYYDQ